MARGGVFITFEGGEGAGKTTLIESVYAELQKASLDVIKTRAPGGTPLGEALRPLILHKHGMAVGARAELLLYLADRAQHTQELIVPALRAGKIVLCDRYNDSTVAYQGGARGFPPALIRDLCGFASDSLQPHLTLYLDIDPQLGLERSQQRGEGSDRLESEAIAFHQKVRAAFHTIAKEEPKRFHLIDATASRKEVFQQAMALITPLVQHA